MPNSVRTGLLPPSEANQLAHFGPEAHRRLRDGVFVGIDDGALPNEIDLMRTEPAGALDNLPADEQQRSNNLHGVVLEECLDAPGLERLVTVAENDEDLDKESQVGTVRLEAAIVRHLCSVDSLGLACSVVADEGDTDDEIVDDSASRHESNEPVEHLG